MQHDNDDRLDALLTNKNYEELTTEEKLFVNEELGSEAQYRAMRKVSLALITSKVDLSPDPFIVNSLEHHMRARRNAQRESIFAWKTPAYATLILLVATSLFSWWLGTKQVTPSIKIVETVKRDTVFVTHAADTVFKDRIIYRSVFKQKKSPNAPLQIVKTIQPSVEGDQGVNMKEKQDLEMLLVSGSR